MTTSDVFEFIMMLGGSLVFLSFCAVLIYHMWFGSPNAAEDDDEEDEHRG